jgi:hypothetical protein
MTRINLTPSVLILLISSIAFSQCISGDKNPVNARTRRVLGLHGEIMPGVPITVRDSSEKILFQTHSDAHGKFTIPTLKDNPSLHDNQYRVEISAPGFRRYRYLLVPSAGSHRTQPLQLVPSAGCNDLKIVEQ